MSPISIRKEVAALCSAVLLLAAATISASTAREAQPSPPPSRQQHRQEAIGQHGMVAAAHPLAAQAGVEVLKRGGSAVDAAVAAAFAIGVVEPFASGLGGGGFAVIHLAKTGETIFVDFQSKAPLAADTDLYVDKLDDQVTGHRASMVPTELAGLHTILQNYGTMSLSAVLEDSIRYAEEGFVVTPYLSTMMKDCYAKLAADEYTGRLYLKDGLPYEPGEQLTNPDLARTLRTIAEQGPEGFYRGGAALALEQEMRSHGGLITLRDMAAADASIRQPVSTTYHGYQIFSAAPTSSGGSLVIEMLNMLEDFDLKKLGHNTADSLHLWAEVARRAFADRASFFGDPDFVHLPLAGLTNKQYAKDRISDFHPFTASNPQAGQPEAYESPSTTHLSVIDRDGNMVAITKTLNHFFGTGIGVPGYGFILNNQGESFNAEPVHPNNVMPGKRPLSSMSPTLVLKDGQPFMSIGSPGSRRIITTTAQVISNIIDYGMSLQEAIEAPRFYADGPLFRIEERIPEAVRSSLARRGHTLEIYPAYSDYFGGVNAVIYDAERGIYRGGGDPRRDGAAIGY